MSDKVSINIKTFNHDKYNGFNLETLSLLFSGDDLNIKLINSLRRACIDGVPGYGFPRELINIKENTTIAYNNDYMTLRLSHLPIFNTSKKKQLNIDPEIDYLHEKYWNDVDYRDDDRLQIKDKDNNNIEKNIEIQIDTENTTDKLINIDTSDTGVKIYIENELIEMYDKKYPILLIKLRPGEKFKCYMKATLGVGELNNIWSNCTNAWHYYEDEENDKNLILEIRSYGLINSYDIFTRGCGYLLKKLSILRKELTRQLLKNKINVESFILELINEDNTIGELINYELQSQKNIIYSGITIPDNLKKNINIKISADSNVNQKKFIGIIEECFDILDNKINRIKKKIKSIKK